MSSLKLKTKNLFVAYARNMSKTCLAGQTVFLYHVLCKLYAEQYRTKWFQKRVVKKYR